MNNKSGNILFVLAFFIGTFLGIASTVYATYYPPMPRKSEPKTCKVIIQNLEYRGLTFSNGFYGGLKFHKEGKEIIFYGTFIVEDE